MNDDIHDITGLLERIVRRETTFLRHYIAQIVQNEDPLKKGRVLVVIPELNILRESEGIWAYPRDKHSMSVPTIDSYVEVYFISGNRNRAVYLGSASESFESCKNYDGDAENHILFEDPKRSQQKIKYKNKSLDIGVDNIKLSGDQLEILSKQIKMLAGTEAFVLGTALDSFLGSLMTWLSAHTHNAISLGSPTSPPLALAPIKPNIVSSKIKGE